MPYIMNQLKLKDGQEMFFQILYGGLAHAVPFVHIVQKLRRDIVQQYAYGFPILYLNGHQQIIPGKDVYAPKSQEPSQAKTKEADTLEFTANPIRQRELTKVETPATDKKTGARNLNPESHIEIKRTIEERQGMDKVKLSVFERAKLKKRTPDEEDQ
jgi:hypothetical protein